MAKHSLEEQYVATAHNVGSSKLSDWCITVVSGHRWAVHDEVRRMRLDKYSWQEVMWRLWASGFAVQCDFSPQRVMLSQLRAGVDKVYVRTLEGTFQEMQQQVDSIEESSATEATSSQQNNNDVKPGPRQLYGTHSNACSTHGAILHAMECSAVRHALTCCRKYVLGHIFRVRDSSNAARRLDAWLSYQFARKVRGLWCLRDGGGCCLKWH